MSGGGGQRDTGTQTVVQTNQLPSFLEGPLKTAAGQAENIFKSGVGSTPFPGATYVPPTADEMSGMDMLRSLSASNPFMGPITNQFTGLLGNQGVTGDHRSSLAPAQAIAQGNIRINDPGFGNLANQFGAPSFAQQNLAGMGSLANRFAPALQGLVGQLRQPSQAQGQLGGIAGGQQIAGAQALQGLLGGFGSPMASEQFLRDAASGQFLGADGNPHFNQALDDASQRTMHAVNAQMAGMGRMGSDAHTGVGSREIGELQTRARADQHNLERQMQMQASGMMDQARLGRQGQQLQGVGMQADMDLARRAQQMAAAGQIDQTQLNRVLSQQGILGQSAGLSAQDLANRMQATGMMDQARLAGLQGRMGALQGQAGIHAANIANQGQTSLALGDQFGAGRDAMLRGMALSPALDQMRLSPARNMIDMGAAQRGELQDELQSNIQRFQSEQMQPWGQLGLLTSALQGFPNMGTVTTNTSGTVPRGSPIAGLLGGASMGAGVGSNFGPWGTGIGGVLGGLGALFM